MGVNGGNDGGVIDDGEVPPLIKRLPLKSGHRGLSGSVVFPSLSRQSTQRRFARPNIRLNKHLNVVQHRPTSGINN